jgi:hypothetical protein
MDETKSVIIADSVTPVRLTSAVIGADDLLDFGFSVTVRETVSAGSVLVTFRGFLSALTGEISVLGEASSFGGLVFIFFLRLLLLISSSSNKTNTSSFTDADDDDDEDADAEDCDRGEEILGIDNNSG